MKRVVHKKKTSKFKTFYFLIVALIIIIGASYAYFTATANNDDYQEVEVKSGCMSLELSDYDQGWSEEFSFGETKSKSFIIKNTCTTDAYASLSFLNMKNTFVYSGLRYYLEDRTDGSYIASGLVKTTSSRIKQSIAKDIFLKAGQKKRYGLTIEYANISNIDQTPDRTNGVFNTQFILENGHESYYSTGDLLTGKQINVKMKTLAGDTNPTIDTVNTSITSFERSYILPQEYKTNNNLISTVSDDNKAVYMWFDNGIIYWYSNFPWLVLNDYSSYMFANLTNITNIEMDDFSTTGVRFMDNMFKNCSNVEILNLTSFEDRGLVEYNEIIDGTSSLKQVYISEKWHDFPIDETIVENSPIDDFTMLMREN